MNATDMSAVPPTGIFLPKEAVLTIIITPRYHVAEIVPIAIRRLSLKRSQQHHAGHTDQLAEIRSIEEFDSFKAVISLLALRTRYTRQITVVENEFFPLRQNSRQPTDPIRPRHRNPRCKNTTFIGIHLAKPTHSRGPPGPIMIISLTSSLLTGTYPHLSKSTAADYPLISLLHTLEQTKQNKIHISNSSNRTTTNHNPSNKMKNSHLTSPKVARKLPAP